jgi:XTP/dITP diphosphohydrolase
MERFWNTVLVASNNRSKVPEIIENLDMDGWQYYPLHYLGIAEVPEETGQDYLENARIKARAAREASSGAGQPMAVIADDSGLEVDALKGAPGINSARYSGERSTDQRNIIKLLEQLKDFVDDERSARFICTVVFLDEEGREISAQGVCEGKIIDKPRGLNGFGYDPVFVPDEIDGERTMAELTAEEKNNLSHRGMALRLLREKLVVHYGFLQHRAAEVGLGQADEMGIACEGCPGCH